MECSNPLAMAEGQKEHQIVKGKDGNNYLITATKNHMDVQQITGDKKHSKVNLDFNETTLNWTLESNNNKTVVAQMIATGNEYTGIKLYNAKGDFNIVVSSQWSVMPSLLHSPVIARNEAIQ